MNTVIRVFATLGLILGLTLAAGPAAAIPVLIKVTPTFFHTGNGNLNTSMIVEASTSLPVLVIGGGFTIACNTSTLQQRAQRMKTYSSFFGPHETLRIPEVAPSTYPIVGWASIPENSCGGECTMQYTAETRDETSLSIRVGSTGMGAGFTLIPQGVQSTGDTLLSNICRTARARCCTATCQFP
jgi:hypothetical protein